MPTKRTSESQNHKQFLIEDIMPERELHLIAGPSGVGKTTLAMQLMEAYIHELPWMGKKCTNKGVAYFSCDRSKASLQRSMDRLGLDPWTFPTGCSRELPDRTNISIDQILDWRRRVDHKAKLLVIDGLARLTPAGKISDYKLVADFLSGIVERCETEDITILGIVHSAKTRDSDKISNPRQRIVGSVSWAGYSDLIITMDPEDAKDPKNPTRVVHILPRDSGEFTVKIRNENGRLVILQDG